MTSIVDTQTEAAEQEFLELFARGPERMTWSDLPPQVGDPLFVSLIDEIRRATQGPPGGIPIEGPWEVRLPTTLVMLQDGPLAAKDRAFAAVPVATGNTRTLVSNSSENRSWSRAVHSSAP